VITAERSCEPVAQGLRRQSAGRTRLIHLGRPWASAYNWDLIITTPQYALPSLPNVARLSLPLQPAPAAGETAEAQKITSEIAALPRPWIALLPGESAPPFVFTRAKAAALGDVADRLAAATGGSLLYCDDSRTPWAAAGDLLGQLRGDNYIYHDASSAGSYRHFLACADAILMTADSAGKLAEAASTGKPLLLFDSSDGTTPWWKLAHNYRFSHLRHQLIQSLLPQRLQTRPEKLQQGLLASNRALLLGKENLSEGVRYLLHSTDSRAGGSKSATSAKELQAVVWAVERLLSA